MATLGLWIGVVALGISLYAAISARRSAAAAERSAKAADRSAQVAEEALALERDEIREAWIQRLAAALPDGRQVTALLAGLPASLRPHWSELVKSAAGRNPRTPDDHFRKLQERCSADWEAAAQGRSDMVETSVQ